MAKRRSCGVRVVKLARNGNCAGAVRAFHKAQLYTHCSDARIGAVRKAIHACLAKGNRPVAGLGMWPFTKKKPKQLPRDPRRMAQTVMYIPSPSGRVNQVLRGARKRRRR